MVSFNQRKSSIPSNLASALLTLTLALSSIPSTTFTTAQTVYDAPVPVTGAAFARTLTKLYIVGGQPSAVDNTPPTSQFYSLDLAAPWSANTPKWTKLPPGPAQSIFPAVFTKDQKTLVVFHIPGTSSVYKYSLDAGGWSASSMSFPQSGWQGVNAVTDPSTGLVYLAGGYTISNRTRMDIYSPTTDTATQQALPDPMTTFGARWYYTNVWSAQRKSILYFGGYNVTSQPGPARNVVSEYVPSTGSWGTMSTSGTPPSMRADHCMTANDDGTKVVVYGGRPADGGPFSGEVFILDTVTGLWTQGATGQPRLYAVCAIAGDQLLVWGGTSSPDVVAPSPVLVYNIGTNTWMSDYTPPASYVAAASASATTSGAAPTGTSNQVTTGPGNIDNKGASNNTGAIVGGVVGGLAVVGAVLGFLFYRRMKQNQNSESKTDVKNNSNGSSPPAPGGSGANDADESREDQIKRMQSQLDNQQQQLEYQRQLILLQQQQQQMATAAAASQPIYVQDMGGYAYQPPVYYPPVPTTTNTVQALPEDTAISYSPTSQGRTHSEIYQVSAEPNFAPSPLVYTPADYAYSSVSSPSVTANTAPFSDGTKSLYVTANEFNTKNSQATNVESGYADDARKLEGVKAPPLNPHSVLN
ncbi:Multiple epidermal growth factor-like domains protein 8 [Linnemannia zychae]|nr:Multiple epidermal growth factor-like domains protein 8 [Linnemannia zychae]